MLPLPHFLLSLALFHSHVSLSKLNIQNCKNMISVQQQREHHHQKVLIKCFLLSGHTFRFHWTVQDLHEYVFLV